MNFDSNNPEDLWQYYQRGYTLLIRSGRFFRQVVRPAFSHVYFHKALPLLQEYAKANKGTVDLPLGFGEQMEAHSLNARDLLHLDYAICLGYSDVQGRKASVKGVDEILYWPGPDTNYGGFIPADFTFPAPVADSDEEEAEQEEDENPDEETPPPSFDL